MQVAFTRHFEKQVDAVKDAKLKEIVSDTVNSVIVANSLNEVPNIKKMKGYKTAYRVRKGDFRIGFIFQHNIVYFLAFAHRKDIYKIFP